jgi:hypothetical protein
MFSRSKPVRLVVSGAAGHVGSRVCKIGKLYGAKVLGIAGRDEKCRWLTEETKIDGALNYKSLIPRRVLYGRIF